MLNSYTVYGRWSMLSLLSQMSKFKACGVVFVACLMSC